jgi:hypothetical protein
VRGVSFNAKEKEKKKKNDDEETKQNKKQNIFGRVRMFS